ncbi:MAG: spore maturation protein [Clostridia bacterium]|nr:spore maturation protein [Clostridia bacterium]
MQLISNYAIPMFVIIIISAGALKKVNVFDSFVSGAMNGFKAVFSIAAPIVGLFAAIGVLRASGTMELIAQLVSPITDLFDIPPSLVNFALLRPVSGSGSLALANDIFAAEGVDSFGAYAASIMMGSTETTFYTLAVYFGSVGVRKTRYAPACSLIGDCVSFVASIIVAKMFFC